MLIGIDEVGRGALFGDVIAVALYFTNNIDIAELTDSKKLSAKKREELFDIINKNAIYSLGIATANEIDELNILNATMLAMKRAFAGLKIDNNYKVLVDGNKCPKIPNCEAIIKGDSLIKEISAASIIAKVLRDREMIKLSNKYPEYGLKNNKGYGTKQHINAIKKFGITKYHRKTFAGVKS